MLAYFNVGQLFDHCLPSSISLMCVPVGQDNILK